jgi:hypothetical protein
MLITMPLVCIGEVLPGEGIPANVLVAFLNAHSIIE